jgi:SAM-dependent methyltransferase
MLHEVNYTKFEQQYLSLRGKEGRIYTDKEVRQLPDIAHEHIFSKEWRIRKESTERLIQYLIAKETKTILEVGCGNGWLCNRLSSVPDALITGLDVNKTELEQATRLFDQCKFIYGDLRYEDSIGTFDAIIFAASIQYFPSPEEIISCCFTHLNNVGEIHIIDTHFYSKAESLQAGIRSFKYFSEIGFPEMNNFYFHHTAQSLEHFNYKMHYVPGSLMSRLFYKNHFPWIIIKK